MLEEIKERQILTIDEVHELLQQRKQLRDINWEQTYIFKSGDKIIMRSKSLGGVFKGNLEDYQFVEIEKNKLM